MADHPHTNSVEQSGARKSTTPVCTQHHWQSFLLDWSRGLASLAVLFGHYRALFFVDYQSVATPSFQVQTIYFVTARGHDAVVIFFVMSGYLISRSLINGRRKGTWTLTNYAAARLSRLYIVLVPALLLGLVLDYIGAAITHSDVYITGHYANVIQRPVLESLNVSTFIGNLFYLQTIAVDTFGSNGPLWSLANEFWYYVFFPILFLLSPFSSKNITRKFILLFMLIFLILTIFRPIAFGFVIWLLGTGVALTPQLALRSKLWSFASLGILATSLVAAEIVRTPSGPIRDLYCAIPFAGFLYIAGCTNASISSCSVSYRAGNYLASISYSLYLLHFPFLVILNAFLIGHAERWQPSVSSIFISITILLSVLTYTVVVWYLTESRTERLRSLLHVGSQTLSSHYHRILGSAVNTTEYNPKEPRN